MFGTWMSSVRGEAHLLITHFNSLVWQAGTWAMLQGSPDTGQRFRPEAEAWVMGPQETSRQECGVGPGGVGTV